MDRKEVMKVRIEAKKEVGSGVLLVLTLNDTEARYFLTLDNVEDMYIFLIFLFMVLRKFAPAEAETKWTRFFEVSPSGLTEILMEEI